jgi:hypothetical protein
LPSLDKPDAIFIELIDVSLENSPPYEALSYTWSTYSDHNKPIYCDGKILRVTPNLEAALRQLRLQDENYLFWIDAICIDQTCTEERNQQVRIMGSIYRAAKCVIIWLGESTTESDIALAILSRFEEVISLEEGTYDEFVRDRLEEIRGTCSFLSFNSEPRPHIY